MKHLLPTEAWSWLQAETARRAAAGLEPPLFVDVRMEIESLYVGRPPGVENIPWYEYPDLTADPHAFAAAVAREAGGDKARPVLLICRSGKRTQDAGAALEADGFTDVAHVVHGFEGDLNDQFKRSTLNGWRHDGLPWEQM
jgi:rhodanese-related sulfurtransferase